MIEGSEHKFAGYEDRMVEAMLSIAEDKTYPLRERIVAAKVVDGANDSFLKSKQIEDMTTEIMRHNDDHKIDSLKQIRDLRSGNKKDDDKNADWNPSKDKENE
jgi:hypothetical protein